MGGTALNIHGVYTTRKNKEEFNYISNEVSNLITVNTELNFYITRSYNNKDSYGDMDVLIKTNDKFTIDIKDLIVNLFKPQAINCNGGVYSFDYDDFQIDFILINELYWDVAKVYYSYDPLGNAMGKIYHKFNLKYGWDGLRYYYRNFNNKPNDKILISTNPRKIFEFADYNYDRFLMGFNSLEEIYHYVASSKFFDYNILKFENLTQIDRKRNKKRKSYHEMIKFFSENYSHSTHNFNENKNEYLPLIDKYFNDAGLLNQIALLDDKYDKIKRINKKFNGRLIMKYLDVSEGYIVRKYLNQFREIYSNDNILSMSENEIKNKIISLKNESK